MIGLLCSSTVALGEEPYEVTRKALAQCVARHLTSAPAINALDDYLREKCRALEEQEQNEFLDFITSKVGEPLTAELAIILSIRIMLPPAEARRLIVESVKAALKKRK